MQAMAQNQRHTVIANYRLSPPRADSVKMVKKINAPFITNQIILNYDTSFIGI